MLLTGSEVIPLPERPHFVGYSLREELFRLHASAFELLAFDVVGDMAYTAGLEHTSRLEVRHSFEAFARLGKLQDGVVVVDLLLDVGVLARCSPVPLKGGS